jgi:hypothetical protein
MICRDHQERIAGYLAGELDDDEKKALDSHLLACPECRRLFDDARAAWEDLDGLPDPEPSAALRSRFYAMLAREKSGEAERPSLLERLSRWFAGLWPRRPAAQVAVALACLAVGFLAGGRLRPDAAPDGEIGLLRSEVADLRQAVSISLMNQASATERLRGIQYSSRVDRPDATLIDTLLNKLRTDPNVNIRLAAVEALYVFSDRPAVRDQLIASLSEQTSPLVQIALIDLLVEARESRSLETLRKLLQDEGTDRNVKQYTETRMKELL